LGPCRRGDGKEWVVERKEVRMSGNVDFDAFQDVLSDFRRDEATVRPAYHSPHGDAEAWRLSEEMHALTAASAN